MRKQVLKLQRKMRELGIDVYVVSDIDEHLSEYVSDHFDESVAAFVSVIIVRYLPVVDGFQSE